MISIIDFKEWLLKDISISTELQKIIIKKVIEYVNSSTIDGKIIEKTKKNIIKGK